MFTNEYPKSNIRDLDKELEAYERLVNDHKSKSLLRKLFKEDNAVNGIAYICVISVFLYIFCVTFFSNGIGEAHLRFVDQSLGNLYGILNTIIGFYCGNAYARSKTANSIITTDKVNIEKQPTLDKNK